MCTTFTGYCQWIYRISTLVCYQFIEIRISILPNFSNIKIVPSGISRAAKKLLQGKVPDLSRFHDISDFMYR